MMPVGTLEQVSPRGKRLRLKTEVFGVKLSDVLQVLLLTRSRACPWTWMGSIQ